MKSLENFSLGGCGVVGRRFCCPSQRSGPGDSHTCLDQTGGEGPQAGTLAWYTGGLGLWSLEHLEFQAGGGGWFQAAMCVRGLGNCACTWVLGWQAKFQASMPPRQKTELRNSCMRLWAWGLWVTQGKTSMGSDGRETVEGVHCK